MSAEDKEIIKLKSNSTAVIASSGYADTLMEELSVAGLTLVDLNDPDLFVELEGFLESTTLDIVLSYIEARQFRKKNVGIIGPKKKKVKK